MPKDINFLNRVREKLLLRKKVVEKEIASVKEDDPLYNDSLAEAHEPGTDSWTSEVHTRLSAANSSLTALLNQIKIALRKIKSGDYGKCTNCGQMIEDGRLAVMPEATLCIKCSKLPKSKLKK